MKGLVGASGRKPYCRYRLVKQNNELKTAKLQRAAEVGVDPQWVLSDPFNLYILKYLQIMKIVSLFKWEDTSATNTKFVTTNLLSSSNSELEW